ncbi:hypothetical protein FHT26_001650 [Rhizobacter sp. SG703]|nr:hypothetical protein [Rhizobacter sp. SG703]
MVEIFRRLQRAEGRLGGRKRAGFSTVCPVSEVECRIDREDTDRGCVDYWVSSCTGLLPWNSR